MSARVEIYRGRVIFGVKGETHWREKRGGWRWRFVKNGRIMADSGQGYSRRIDALNGCATVLGGEVVGPWLLRGVGVDREQVLIRDLTREAAS